MDKPMYIFGCGGHARSIISALRRFESNRTVILVDNNCKENETILSCETIKEDKFWEQNGNRFSYIIGIGDNLKRACYFEKMRASGGIAENVIAESALIGLRAEIGTAVYVGENAYIGPETKIGNNSIINTAAIVEHECSVGEHVHVAPNTTVCGRCVIGNYVFLGAGSVVIDNVRICDKVIIGAGSVVTKDIVHPGVYVGCPAKRIHE